MVLPDQTPEAMLRAKVNAAVGLTIPGGVDPRYRWALEDALCGIVGAALAVAREEVLAALTSDEAVDMAAPEIVAGAAPGAYRKPQPHHYAKARAALGAVAALIRASAGVVPVAPEPDGYAAMIRRVFSLPDEAEPVTPESAERLIRGLFGAIDVLRESEARAKIDATEAGALADSAGRLLGRALDGLPVALPDPAEKLREQIKALPRWIAVEQTGFLPSANGPGPVMHAALLLDDVLNLLPAAPSQPGDEGGQNPGDGPDHEPSPGAAAVPVPAEKREVCKFCGGTHDVARGTAFGVPYATCPNVPQSINGGGHRCFAASWDRFRCNDPECPAILLIRWDVFAALVNGVPLDWYAKQLRGVSRV